MKKVMILAALMLVGVLQGMSQETENRYYEPANSETDTPKGFWGVRVNIDVTVPGEVKDDGVGVEMFNPGPGLSVGAIYNVPINKRFYFEPGLYLQLHNTGYKKKYIDVDNANMLEYAMRVPLLFGIKFPTRTGFFTITTGPGLSVGLSGKTHVKDYGETASIDMYKDGIRRFDLNWNVGFAIYFKDYMIGLNGYYGLLNSLKDGDGASWHQNYITIGFGYNFK